MGLTTCPKCGETISDKATVCPHCNSGVSKKTNYVRRLQKGI